MLSDEEATRIFTPSAEEQTLRVLKDQCPHNRGWRWTGHGHNDDCYECRICHESMWY